MAEGKPRSEDPATRRREAEELARRRATLPPEGLDPATPEGARRLLHELQVHQIELELQNEELRRAQVEVEALRSRYFDLYDMAPVGYFTVSEPGLVLHANLTAAGLLGLSRAGMMKQRLSRFILPADQDLYQQHWKRLLETGLPQAFDLRMRKEDGTEFWAHLSMAVAQDAEGATVFRTILMDATIRMRAEVSLRDSEERATKIFRAIPDGIIVTRLADGRVVDVNESFCHLSGWSREELLGRTVLELHLWDQVEERNAYLEDLRRSGRVVGRVARYRRQSGEVRTVALSAELLVHGPDQLVMAICHDITERRRAEAHLEQQNALLNALINSPADLRIFSLDRDGRYTAFNDRHRLEMRKVWQAEIQVGMRLLDCMTDARLRRLAQQSIDRALAGEAFTEIQSQEGLDLHYEFVWNPIRGAEGRVVGVTAFIRDISVARRADRALQESEERLRLALQAAQQGLYDLNVQTGEAVVSPEYATMLGYDPATFHETNAAWLERLHPEDRETVGRAYTDYIAGRTAEYRVEFRQRTRSGDWKWVLSLGRIVERAPDGAPLRMLGTHTDITERKADEAQLLGQGRVLELIARDAPLEESLNTLIALLEARFPAMLCSVLLLDADGRHLRHGAAPSLPPEYIRAVDGLAVGPEAGSCGTAAFRRAPVFVEDIATDALWVAHKDLALPHGLRACWSTPIFDPEGSLLGCFAVYYRQPGLPPPEHQRVIEYGTQVASIAIFRKLSNEALLRSETKFRTLFDGAPDSVLLLDASGLLDCNETAVAVFGAGSRDNLLALHPSDFSPPCQPGGGASRMLADQRIAAALASGHQRFEWVHRRIDTGETFPAEVLLTALELDGNRILQAVVRDISERTRAEAATRAMAERLTLATDAAGIGTWDWDLRQNTWQCSPNYYAIMGQEPEDGIADRERWLASLHPEDRRAVVAQAEAVLAGRERSYEYEARILQADGSYRWAHVAGRAAEVDEDGRVLRMLGVRMDITARKLAEAELRENEDRFRDLVENSRELISTYDLEGNFLSVNRRTAELTGYSREALLTMNLSDLLDPGARHLFPEYLQTMRAEGRAKGIMKIRTVQGETRYWEYDTTLRTDGVAQPIIRGMGLDITEALHADRALRASETQLRVILESTDDGILAVDRRGRILKANQRFAELWRVPPALLAEGQDRALLDHVLDQLADPGAFLEKVASLYESDATDLDLIRFKDGRCFERFSAPMWQGQTVTGRVWSFRDITQRKRAERALAGSLERFELANRATFNVIWDWDLVTHAFWRNDKFEILFGYKSEEVEPGVSTAFRLVHPDDMERVRAGIEAALASAAEFWTDTYRFSRKDGSFATVQDRALITRDEEGRAIRMLGAMQDISEQKATEQALRESETKLRMIIEHSQQLFYTHTVDNAVTYVSPQVREFFETGPEDSYRPWTDFLTDNPVNALGLEISQRAIDTGKRQPPYQLEMVSAKGRKFWVEVHETPVVEGGRTVAMVGALTDITLSKRASDQLRLQGGALEAAANAIVITDREGLVEWANAAFTTMTGYPVAEAIGRTPGFLLKSGRQEEGFYKAMWDTLAAGEVWRGEIINKRRDGRHYPEDMTITPLRDERGAITHFVAIKQDITQRVEAEEELHRYTERLEALREIDAALLGARSTPELARGALVRLRHIVPFERAAVVLFDPELTKGTLIAVDQDQPWRPLAGESRPLGEFHDLGELRAAPFLNLQDLETARSCVLEQLLLSQGLRNLVYVPMEGEGALLGFVALSATTPGLLTPGHAEIAQDMTSQLAVALQHLRLKEELERANLRLESKVEERTAELQSTVATLQVLEGELRQREAEARAASEAKSTFLSSMSHELRTPLIGVTGMLEVLSQGDLNPQQRQVVDIIQESSESLLHIIGDILDFSKIEANKLELVPQAFSAQALVESVSHAFRSSISAKGLTCLVEVDPGIAPAHVADALRLRQILNNFMSNALKFTEQGSITLRLRKLGAGEGRETLAFEVADTGIGVSEENQKKLFAPFTQAEDSTTRRFGGTGLGLVISRRMAELMGGNLRMHSAVGQGTTMHLEVTVPIGDERNLVRALPEAAEAEPLRPAPSLEEAVRERSLVLLAEDHPTNRIVITQQVNRAGFALEVAVDGQEAFERWQSGRYALILTDLHMPRMDGVQLTQAVRERERERGLPRTPILALTANALGGEAARCLELGMDDYLIKPVNIALLASKLHQWLPHVAAAAGAPVPPADAAPDPDPEPGFDPALLLALCGGDGAAAKGILEEFLQATRDDLDELREALDRKDRPALARQAHRVKGSSAMVGARELAQRAAELEACARNDSADWSELQGRVAGMQEALAAIPRHS